MEKSELESVLNVKVKDLKVSAGAVAGAGVAGTLLALDVTTANNKKLHLVHKSINQSNPVQKEFLIKNQSFLVETTFYMKLVPALEAFAKSKGFPRSPVVHLPKYYGGVVNNDTDFLLLEDLRADGYQMSDKHVGLTLDEASFVLQEMATFHALTYAFLRWEGAKILEHPDFKIFGRSLFDDPEFQAMGGGLFNGAFQVGIDLVAVRNPELAEKMKVFNAKVSTMEQMHATAFKTDNELFPVIIFGDLWTNNVLFKRDTNGKVQQAKLIDFQIARRSNIFEELQYFMFTSTTPVFRATYLTQVLEIYYKSFEQTVKQLGCPIPIGFTKGFLLDNFFKCYPSAYKYMAFAIPLQLAENPDAVMNPGSEGGQSGDGPPQGPPPGMPNGEIDPSQMLAFQIQMFTQGIKLSMESSPKAVDRLYDITEEMAQLNII